MYVSDIGNGVFKISHKSWTIPAVIKLKEKLLDEIRQSNIAIGIKNSLVQKLVNVDKDLEEGRITSAINLLSAFKYEVRAQRGKKIPGQDLAGEDLRQPRVVDPRNLMEDARLVHAAFGHQVMEMGVQINPVPKGLDG